MKNVFRDIAFELCEKHQEAFKKNMPTFGFLTDLEIILTELAVDCECKKCFKRRKSSTK